MAFGPNVMFRMAVIFRDIPEKYRNLREELHTLDLIVDGLFPN